MDAIDVKGLPEEQARLLRDFAEFLKAKTGMRKDKKPPQKIALASWPAKIKGNLTRKEIYGDR